MSENINEIKNLAETLRNKVRLHSKEIDNPALTTSFLNEIDFFIENVEDVDDE